MWLNLLFLVLNCSPQSLSAKTTLVKWQPDGPGQRLNVVKGGLWPDNSSVSGWELKRSFVPENYLKDHVICC